MQPHYSQSSRENTTPSRGTFPLAYYKEVPPPPGMYGWAWLPDFLHSMFPCSQWWNRPVWKWQQNLTRLEWPKSRIQSPWCHHSCALRGENIFLDWKCPIIIPTVSIKTPKREPVHRLYQDPNSLCNNFNYTSITFDVNAYLIVRCMNVSVISSIPKASTLPSPPFRVSLLT